MSEFHRQNILASFDKKFERSGLGIWRARLLCLLWMLFAAPWVIAGPPTHLAVFSVNYGSSPILGVGFSVLVESRDASGVAQPVVGDTIAGILVSTGTDMSNGIKSCVIPAGTNGCTLSGYIYSVAESGVVLETFDESQTPTLMPGYSAPFTVIAASIPGAERGVLDALYMQTNGAGWTDNPGWEGAAGTECSWYGITCDVGGTHITAIELLGNNLVGSLPDFTPLASLTKLWLGDNQLTGPIPSLNALANLTSVLLHDNQLSGSIPSLAGLTNLATVLLDNNQLSGVIPGLTGLSNLGSFSVRHNQLTGFIPPLNGSPYLYLFIVGDNQLTGSIPDLSNNPLLSIQVGGNHLTGNVPASAPTSPANGAGHSALCDNALNHTPNPSWDIATGVTPWYSGCVSSPPTIPASERAVLDAIYAQAGGANWYDHAGWEGDPGTECTWSRVICYYSPATDSSGVQQAFIGELDLNSNQLNGTLPDLSALTHLTAFYAQDNQLSGSIPSLAPFIALQIFDVGYNNFGGALPAAPPNYSSGQLVYVRFCPNALDQTSSTYWDTVTATSPWYSACATGPSNLPTSERDTLLALYAAAGGDNWWSRKNWGGAVGTECTWFGVECNLDRSHVTGFEVSYNGLVGSLADISGLSQLQRLNVSDNQLSGPVPSLSSLNNLLYIDVSNNQFSGKLPSPMSSFANLQFFRAGTNQFTGQIPPLTSLMGLRFFSVEQNLLTGSIPNLDGLINLRLFWVRSNLMTGTVPSLSTLTNLQSLNIRDNRFTGTLPSLAGLNQLALFYVRNNGFTGELPAPPSPNALSTPGLGASLCNNPLNHTANADWDSFSGSAPWYTNCTTLPATLVINTSNSVVNGQVQTTITATVTQPAAVGAIQPAKVPAAADPPASTASGTVIITDNNGNTICTITIVNGTGSCTVVLSSGVTSLNAGYSGDTTYAPGGGNFTVVAPVTLSAAVSRATHGHVGTFDLPINITAEVDSNTITVEPRGPEQGNLRHLIFTFSGPVTSVSGVQLAGTATSVLPTGTAGTATFDSNNVIVPLTGVPDRKRLQVTLTDINGIAGANATVSLAYLLGDVTQDRQVTGLDGAITGAKSPSALTSSNFLYNVTLSGSINALDKAVVSANSPKAAE